MDNIILWTSYFLVLLATGFCQNDPLDASCSTNTYNGTCVVITSCPPAISLVQIRDINKLRSMFCGFEDKNPKVCCPPEGTSIIFQNKTDDTATSRPKKTTTVKPEETTTSLPKISSGPLPSRSVCGQVIVADKIVGGTVAEIDEFPWLARIKYSHEKGDEMFACSASLITNRHLLTAAHCVKDNFLMKPINVRLGEWDEQTVKDCVENHCNDKPVDIDINKIIVYPNYSKINKTQHDIALLELKEPVVFTEFIRPVCLPTTEYIAMQDYVDDSSYWTAGWGITEFGNASPVKRKVKLDAVSTDICQNVLPNVPKSSFPTLICAGGRLGEDSCKGDSGGSLVRQVSENDQENWYLFGITSLGTSLCGTEGVPGLYTRITPYISWIIDTINT